MHQSNKVFYEITASTAFAWRLAPLLCEYDVSAIELNNKKNHGAKGAPWRKGHKNVTVNGQQAHSEKVNCGGQVLQQSHEPWNAFLSLGFRTSTVYNRKVVKSSTELVLAQSDLNT